MTALVDSMQTRAPAAGIETPAAGRVACFHCGEPCADDSFSSSGKAFCCNGCLTVHDILSQSGLGQFYELSEKPGVRMRRTTAREQFAYLDEPALQQRLLDFTDGRNSRITLKIPAIHCIACVWLLENLFRLHRGIGNSRVNFPKREVAIQFAAQRIKLSELIALLSSIGYEPTLTLGELEKPGVNPARKRQWLQIGVAGFAFGNIMLLSIPQYFGLDSLNSAALKGMFGWLSLTLALPVVIFSASDYWKSALIALRRRILTLDVPIALGLAAIYGQSAYEIISRTGEGYFDSLTGLIFFLLCGRAFQQVTNERMAFDRDYKSFFPLSVTRVGRGTSEAHGSTVGVQASACFPDRLKPELQRAGSETGAPIEERVSLSQLRVGDVAVIRNGELIPADALLVNGPALIDYSFVTGESEPVSKNVGEHLYAGGRQIGAAIEVEIVKRVSQSYLASLWGHEAFQKDDDDNLNTLTNRYSRRFTLLVIAVALGAAAFWIAGGNVPRSIKAFASVLIVACPCALALAAPFTLGTAQRILARLGVFLKSSQIVERMARIDAIVFDKTGTLTAAGANAVTFIGANEPLTPALSPRERENRSPSHGTSATDFGSTIVRTKEIPQPLFPLPGGEGQGEGGRGLTQNEETWIYSMARHSTHPHSVRIGDALAQRNFPETVRSFLETPGCGIEGQVQGREIWIGSQTWLKSRGAVAGRRPTANSGSVVHVAIDGKYRGAFVLSSALRPETDQLVRQLASRYELALLSGDNERERERFRQLFGDNAKLHFNQSPLDKLEFIHRLQREGRTVMMVGDGLNDAGALKQSDVGVAVIENVGAFSPASDAIVDAANVPQLVRILALARRSAKIVRIAFAISAAYNVVGVSIAAAGLLSPLVCAVLMPVSSISVVLFACGMTTWAARKLRNGKLGVERSTASASQLSALNPQLLPTEVVP